MRVKDANILAEESGDDALSDFFVTDEERQSILIGTTAPLAPASTRSSADVRELMTFWVADEQYGLGINELQEIIKVPEITKVPRVSDIVLGIISLRGTIVPLLDLRRVLRLDVQPLTRQARILVVHSEDDWVGLVVDRVISVSRIEADRIEPAPISMDAELSEMLEGVGRVGNQMVIVLDVKAVLRAMELAA